MAIPLYSVQIYTAKNIPTKILYEFPYRIPLSELPLRGTIIRVNNKYYEIGNTNWSIFIDLDNTSITIAAVEISHTIVNENL